MQPRWWESWDDLGVAGKIEQYWRSKKGFAHRQALAGIVKREAPAGKILEVGCGSGLIYRALWNELPHLNYTGVDNSREMLKLANRNFPLGHFIWDDAFSLDFSDNSFDTVVSFEVLVHLPDIVKPIAEMLRVAAKCVIFSVWHSADKTTTEKTKRWGGEFLRRRYAYPDVVAAIKAAGMVCSITTSILPGAWVYVIRLSKEKVKHGK